METTEHELIKRFIKVDAELRRLYAEHIDLEAKLIKFQTRTFLTAQEEIEQKRLKMKKLMGVERMMEILSGYRGRAKTSNRFDSAPAA